MIIVAPSGVELAVFAAFVGVFGLLIGSFLNVVVYRVPQGLSLVAPPSACPHCGHSIRPYDNIPVVSWLVLRARCRGCGNHISARYPLVEAGTGVFFAVIAVFASMRASQVFDSWSAVSGGLVLLAFLYLAAISVALGLIDLDTRKLPNRIVLPSYVVAAVLLAGASITGGTYDALIRAGIGMAGLFAVYAIMAYAFPGGMGLGDVKLAGVLGLYLGWIGWGALLVGAFAAFLLGGMYAVGLIITKRANRKSGVPFGPWMLAGAWIGIALGNAVFAAYLTLFGLTAG